MPFKTSMKKLSRETFSSENPLNVTQKTIFRNAFLMNIRIVEESTVRSFKSWWLKHDLKAEGIWNVTRLILMGL